MIKFRSYSPTATITKDDVQVTEYTQDRFRSRFAQYMDGSIEELTAADFAGFTEMPTTTGMLQNLKEVDLGYDITSIPKTCLYLCSGPGGSIGRIIFPPKLSTIYYQAFTLTGITKTTLDFSRATIIPTLQTTTSTNDAGVTTTSTAFTGDSGPILVPASLYNSWKTASGWKTLSDRIFAV